MSASFQRFAGLYGLLAGASGLLYLIFFILLRNSNPVLSALFLMLLGVLAAPTVIALYLRVRGDDEGFALWGLLLAIAGTAGAAIHGAYDLANAVNPPASTLPGPSAVDPRGFLTFAVGGLGGVVLAWLLLRGRAFPNTLAYLGIVNGALLVLLYIAYMILVNATNPLVLILIFATGILNPVWYLWLGWLFFQGRGGAAARR